MSHQNEIRLLLLGKTGAGKSRTGNTLLGDPTVFEFSSNPNPGTPQCQKEIRQRFERQIVVVDTPGVYHAEGTEEQVGEDIKDSMIMLAPGPHAIVLCVPMCRFDEVDMRTLQYYVRHFGEEIMQYVILVFTHLDTWKATMEDKGNTNADLNLFISNLPNEYKDFLEKIKRRYVAFDNRKVGGEANNQALQLINIINDLTATSGGQCYSNDTYQKIQELLTSSDGTETVQTIKKKIPWDKIIGCGTAAAGMGLTLFFAFKK